MVNHLPPQKLDEHQQLMDVITDLQRQKADREGAGPPPQLGLLVRALARRPTIRMALRWSMTAST